MSWEKKNPKGRLFLGYPINFKEINLNQLIGGKYFIFLYIVF